MPPFGQFLKNCLASAAASPFLMLHQELEMDQAERKMMKDFKTDMMRAHQSLLQKKLKPQPRKVANNGGSSSNSSSSSSSNHGSDASAGRIATVMGQAVQAVGAFQEKLQAAQEAASQRIAASSIVQAAEEHRNRLQYLQVANLEIDIQSRTEAVALFHTQKISCCLLCRSRKSSKPSSRACMIGTLSNKTSSGARGCSWFVSTSGKHVAHTISLHNILRFSNTR
jgi:hypothetical protein